MAPSTQDSDPSHGICVIVNPGAGGGARSRDDDVREALDAAGVEAEIRPIGENSSPGAAARAAVEAGFGTIVAAGGDGTASGVADAVFGSGADVRFGLLPFGTFNFFARGLGLPLDPREAAHALRAGRTRGVRLGTVNGRIFLNNMSLGLYPSILENREDVYERWGRSRPAAYWSVLMTLTGLHRPMRMTLRMNGSEERIATPLVFVAASAYQLSEYNLDGEDAVREGSLALFFARKTRGADLVRDAWSLARGRAREGEEFEIRTAAEFEIRLRTSRLLVARDGEREEMASPIRVARADRPMQIIVPDDP